MFSKGRSLTNLALKYSFFFFKKKKKLALILNHPPFKSKEFLQNFFLSVLTFAFLRTKACFTQSLFFGTANLKRTITPKHGAMWGIDIVLNYLKEINNASCPWTATSVRKAIHSCLRKVPLQRTEHFSAPGSLQEKL